MKEKKHQCPLQPVQMQHGSPVDMQAHEKLIHENERKHEGDWKEGYRWANVNNQRKLREKKKEHKMAKEKKTGDNPQVHKVADQDHHGKVPSSKDIIFSWFVS